MRYSRTRARVVSDYVLKSCHDGYRFVTGGLEDIQFSEVLKNQGSVTMCRRVDMIATDL